ncbi:MAG: hypothetical protein ACJAUH_000521 [Saprospiraceae bacterium]|jgi:hypothetical protein
MSKKNLWIVTLMIVFLSCNKEDELVPENPQGYNMLLIGNSFFRPYAENLDALAIDAGFENHSVTGVFRGGDNGRPINFWNDSLSNQHNSIKAALELENIDLFGMTAGRLPDNPTDGFREWIEYALQYNPNITIFLSIPPLDFPADWNQTVQDNGFVSIEELYDYFINETIHSTLVDELRAEFPSTNIFTIPTGWAAINLAQMNQDSLLLDNISMFGPKATSIFTDDKGHQGQLVIETGTLLWLNSIYNVDLNTNTYETGFSTDLHEIAKQIMDNHDSYYKQ